MTPIERILRTDEITDITARHKAGEITLTEDELRAIRQECVDMLREWQAELYGAPLQ